jgi:hypothetical protein
MHRWKHITAFVQGSRAAFPGAYSLAIRLLDPDRKTGHQQVLAAVSTSARMLSLNKQCPFSRKVLKVGTIVAIPRLDGLHHRYKRAAP